MQKNKNHWIPEICYEEEADGLSSHIPFIQVPSEQEMPSILYIFESRETGEFEPGLEGNPVPVIELDLHQYADLSILKKNLDLQTYDVVRSALGLEPLKDAAKKGEKITSNIRQKVEN
jgi:hypothetical protein